MFKNKNVSKTYYTFLVPTLMILLLFIENKQPVEGQVTELKLETDDQDSDSTRIEVLPGFEVQKLYSVPLESQGSWVSLGLDDQGYLIASDQQEKGTYRIKVDGDQDGPEVNVEKITMPLSGAQGLTWAFDHLYGNVNGVGLYRMRDSRASGDYTMMEFLGGPANGGEHGNHTVIETADGQGLYYIAGNHTPPPAELTRNRAGTWGEDLLLPRLWDARGHARGIMAPGGWIARINPDATKWEMVSMGYRNQYDAALNEHDELFTYDADMEWDYGTPWYRPTAIVHVTSGSDFGWRSGSGKWPNYYEDKLPPLLEIGPGSPTGFISGEGALFPDRYQRAMFALDWTFGTMYAIHMTPEGASYKAEAEEFLSGIPLPLTSAVIGKDGALYFTTGGRNQDSHLYRVIYTGDESIAPATPVDDPEARAARELRHQLESFHGLENPEAVDVSWPHLGSEDRILRYAARLAVEAQPVNTWADRALTEERTQARITGLVALARAGSSDHRSDAIRSLMELRLADLSPEHQLGWLRAMSLVFIRLGDPNEEERVQITESLQKLLPGDDNRVNTELIRVLVYLRDPDVIEKALTLMKNEAPAETPAWANILERNEDYGSTLEQMLESPPPIQELHYAFMLRNLTDGWTIDQRREYFTFINDAADRMGGESYSGFLEDIRYDALDNATDEERAAVADIVEVSLAQQPNFDITPINGPGREWALDGAMEELAGNLNSGSDRNFEQGRNAFFATGCASCHRFDGFGGDIGPDLGTVGRRFNNRRLVEKIIDPNILISDQYNTSEVTMKNGDTIVGLIAERSENLEIYTRDPDQPPTVVLRDDVSSIEDVKISQMPPGLINSLNPDELSDLIAYLRSGGDPDNDMFKSEREMEEDSKASNNFTSMFNGQDLTGWDGDPRFWHVENGVLVGETTEENATEANTFLIWEENEPADFEVSLSYRFVIVGDEEHGNSGMQIRSERFVSEDTPELMHRVRGPQPDMAISDWIPGIIYDEGGRGVLARRGQHVLIDAEGESHEERFADEADLGEHINHTEWNEYHVYANKDTIRTSINDQLMHELIDQSPQAMKDGIIAFQLHTGPPMRVELKDIQIKLLD
ncbi:MAG: family 16 glycoside hydrolase [Balneolales bacterium]